jgi:RNA polymerase sigma factor (sigma-70 family)
MPADVVRGRRRAEEGYVAAVPAEVPGPSDAELIESVRGGQLDAYGSLYERHVSAAYNLARQLTRSSAEADDLVSEAFARVLDTLRAGRGPDSAFRAYLLTSLRHVAYDKTRKDRKVELTDDVTTVSGISTEKISEPFRDTAMAGLERSLAAKAFARLPERWQAVLWHTEIEGQSPAEVAPLLGLTANGVSALAYRAREGLRQAYLQVHLAETTAGRCRATADKLGAWTRGGLSKRETVQVESHLDECERCRALAAELADVNGGLRVVATLVLGIGAAGYLAATTKAATGAAVVAAASTTGAGTAGAAAGAAGSVPRQFVGVGASVAALAAVLALALTGGSTQTIPASAPVPPPPPAPTAPAAPPAPPAPHPAPPAPPAPPAAPPAAPPPAAPAPAVPPVVPSPVVAPPAPPPAPGQPTLTAAGPADGVTLVPGQSAVELPITVKNTGTATSQPVVATLALPSGVHVVNGDPAPHALQAQPISDQIKVAGSTSAHLVAASTSTVQCTSATCSTQGGLAPGDSVKLVFDLAADAGTPNSTITGRVTSGTAVSVTVSVRVKVNPPPTVDGLALSVRLDQWDSWWSWLWDGSPVVDITATNTGSSTKPVTVAVDRAGTVWTARPSATCTGARSGVTCVTTSALAPGQSAHLRVRVYHLRARVDTVTVTATLGTAHESKSITIRPPRCPWPWCWQAPKPTPPGSTTPPPPTTGTQPPSESVNPTTPSTQPPTTKPGPPSQTPPPTTQSGPPSTTPAPTTTPNPTTTRPPTTTIAPPTTTPPGCTTGQPGGGAGKIHPGAPCLPILDTLFSLINPL